MSKVIYEKDGRIGRVTLNRPDVLNAIDDELPGALADCVERANADPGVHVIVLSGAGRAFCAGYDLTAYAQTAGANNVTQDMPWDPMKDYAFMMKNTELFMSLWRSYRPVICKVHGFAVAGGSDIALCADTIIMADDAEIGYMPTRVWGCPTTAMWVYRIGPERAKRMLFTGDKIKGPEAEKLGLDLDRLHADPRLGLPDDGDVGLSHRPGARETDAVHWRQDQGSRSRETRTGSRSATCRPASGAARRRRCGSIASARSARNGCCSLATRSRVPKPRNSDWC